MWIKKSARCIWFNLLRRFRTRNYNQQLTVNASKVSKVWSIAGTFFRSPTLLKMLFKWAFFRFISMFEIVKQVFTNLDNVFFAVEFQSCLWPLRCRTLGKSSFNSNCVVNGVKNINLNTLPILRLWYTPTLLYRSEQCYQLNDFQPVSYQCCRDLETIDTSILGKRFPGDEV